MPTHKSKAVFQGIDAALQAITEVADEAGQTAAEKAVVKAAMVWDAETRPVTGAEHMLHQAVAAMKKLEADK
jgi:hypothetical protein